MSAISVVFPHQLFKKNPALKKDRPVYLVEEYLFFKHYNFHKQKLVFHRASMKAYADFLKSKGYTVEYIDATDKYSDIRNFIPKLNENSVSEMHYVEVTDLWLQQRMTRMATQHNLKLIPYDSPLFLLPTAQVNAYFNDRKRLHQTDFYIQQRKHFKILVDNKYQPEGGKWTFDTENRLKYPKGKTPPEIDFPQKNGFWTEAVRYVEENFKNNYGEISKAFVYPTTFAEGSKWIKQFLKVRFREFGDFEDAIVSKEHILHHSVLTPMMNVGLLTPDEVLDEVIEYANENSTPINSVEGFVRQILGWREFIRGVYETKGVYQRTKNYWNFKRKIPASFWNATTGIEPIDTTIKKILATGYCHHIERLMVLGNFMLLCEFDPDEVYQWFMELFIDSYDWVMVPNVYGMSQFSDGGLMATKPYISGSNYLMKMSDYKKGPWQPVWDGLFWRFLHSHRDFFSKNPRLSMLLNTFDKMPEEKRTAHLRAAENFLKTLDKSKRYE